MNNNVPRSSLIDEVYLSPNYNPRGNNTIKYLTPHCIVGQARAIDVAKTPKFTTNRTASANYIIGRDGERLLNVEEFNRAWTSGGKAGTEKVAGKTGKLNDYQAITFECASDPTHPYGFNDKVYTSLFLLWVDICKRYNKTKVVWIPDVKQALAYNVKDNELQVTLHRWFASVECPGQWLVDKMQTLVTAVNQELTPSNVPPVVTDKYYKVQVGAFKYKDNADTLLAKLKAQGYTDAYIKYE